MEVARYCGGRVNGCQPLKADAAEDFVLDSFCDVRFEQAKFASLIRIFFLAAPLLTYIYIHACVYAGLHIFIYVCIYIIYIYIHTYAYIYV